MTTVADLFDRLGRNRITAETGHGAQVLSRAVVQNVMPSSWYPGIRDLCSADGIPCPEHLFRWAKRPEPRDRQAGAA